MANNDDARPILAIIDEQAKDLSDNNDMEEHWIAAARKRYGSKEFELIERAWAAGLFDGEGHVSVRANRSSIRCEVQQIRANRFVLERFMRIVGVGKIKDLPQRAKGNHQPACSWSVSNQADLLRVWEAIGHFLCSAKRDQFSRAMSVPIRTILNRDGELPAGMTAATVAREKDGRG
jgi:hypothetical protein